MPGKLPKRKAAFLFPYFLWARTKENRAAGYLSREEPERAEEKGYPVHRGKDGNKINSGWLIEQAGLKGQLLHGIRVNEKACLVLINESATSYNDLKKARDEITSIVYDKFGYWLEQEPVELR